MMKLVPARLALLLICGTGASALLPTLHRSLPTRCLSGTAALQTLHVHHADALTHVPLRAARVERRTKTAQMGLFGLGWAELGIIGVIALFIFGPEKLAPFAKELGKSAGSLKEVTDSFSEGMTEGTAKVDELKSANIEPVTLEAKKVEEKKEEKEK